MFSSRPVKGVIFDFDGTLYGDAKLWTRLIAETLDSEYQVRITPRQALDKARSMISDGSFYNISGIAIALAKDQGVIGEDLRVRTKFLEKLDRIMDDTGPDPSLVHLLENLQDAKIRMGIVTFQRLPRLKRRLDVWNFKQYFDSIVTPDDVPEFKPSPLPFTRAIGELGMDASESVVVGDEEVDMIGAKKAGSHAIGIPDGFFTKDELARAGAEAIVQSIEELHRLLLGKSTS